MGEVYVYDKWTEDFSTTGLCGALTPFSCRHEEIAGGMSAVTLEHPFDDLGRWQHIQRGNVLKCLCRVRTTPEILNGQVVTAVEVWTVLDTATKAQRGVYTKAEAIARANIQLENYTKIINIEALTLLEMAKQDIIPAVSDYVADLCTNVAAKQAVNDSIPCTTERDLIMKLSEGNDRLSALIFRLEDILSGIDMNEVVPASQAMAHKVIPVMEEMRTVIDGMEKITSSEYWPYPTYFDILYSVK